MSDNSPGGLYKDPTKEESERLREEGGQIKFIDIRFERRQAVGFGKGRRRQDILQIARAWDE